MAEEKTGGTRARMEPGEERAFIKNQREPIIEGEGKGSKAFQSLLTDARAIMRGKGHVPEDWQMYPEQNSARLRCATCHRECCVAQYPMRDGTPVSGPAVEEGCAV